MKKFIFTVLAFAMTMFASVSFAQSYAYTNPTYIPTAQAASVTYTAPGVYAFTAHDIGTIGINVKGTCTSLAAVAQVSVDGVTWATVNVYPVVTGTVTAATSISAAGTYRANAAGVGNVRLNITALTASCTVTMDGTSQTFTNLF